MTIDLVKHRDSRRQRTFNAAAVKQAIGGKMPDKITDIVAVFGGWGQSDAGQPFDDPHATTGTGKLLKRIREVAETSPNKVIVKAFQGALGAEGPRGEQAVFDLVREHLHPAGKLILYGYSAGGFSAMRVCYRLGMSYPYFVIQWRTGAPRRALMPYPPFTRKGTTPDNTVIGFVRVDCLLLVDAAAGPLSSYGLMGKTQRRAWPSVRHCINYYQQHASRIGSHGGTATAFDPSVTTVTNHDLTARYDNNPEKGHGRMDEDTLEEMVAHITAALLG